MESGGDDFEETYGSDFLFSVSYDDDSDTFTLMFYGVEIETTDSKPLYKGIECTQNLDIILANGTANRVESLTCGIEALGNVTIAGGGLGETLTVESDTGISAPNVTISGGSITLTGVTGISVTGTVDISGGTVSAFSSSKGIDAGSLSIFGGCTVTAEGGTNGIYAGTGDIGVSGSTVTAEAQNGKAIFAVAGDVFISGTTTILNVESADGGSDVYGILADQGEITISDAEANIKKYGNRGYGAYAKEYLVISGGADVTVVDWSTSGSGSGLYSESGSVVIGGTAQVDICSGAAGIYADWGGVYVGYTYDGAATTPSGSPTVKINDAASVSAITPYFTIGPYGIWASGGGMHTAGGTLTIRARSGGNSKGIFVNGGDARFEGGDVTIGAEALGVDSYGIHTEGGDVRFEDGSVTVTAEGNIHSCGIYGRSVYVAGGAADITASEEGTNYGIYAESLLSVSDGSLRVQSNGSSESEESLGVYVIGNAGISGGTVDVTASGSGPAKGISVTGLTEITGGIVSVRAAGGAAMGIVSAGNTSISGGSATVTGTRQSFSNTGGSVIVASSPYKHRVNAAAVPPSTAYSYYPDTAFVDSGSNKYVRIAFTQPITLASAENGNFAAIVDGTPASIAGVGDMVTLSPDPEEGYALSSWNVHETGDDTGIVTLSGNSFTMPAYAVTVQAGGLFRSRLHGDMQRRWRDGLTGGGGRDLRKRRRAAGSHEAGIYIWGMVRYGGRYGQPGDGRGGRTRGNPERICYGGDMVTLGE